MSEAQVLHHPSLSAVVRFRWASDRYVHEIDAGGQSLSTFESDIRPNWPAAPPLQQLSIEAISERPVAFGVGCAGSSHWSVSVESTETGFRFDWACKTKESPEYLGTQYEGTAMKAVVDASNCHQITQWGHCFLPAAELQGAGTYRWCYEIEARSSG
ncbi:MAG: hypothetical protein AAFV88_22610 [Planctomycetota bacterium]